jgi:integrase
VASIRRRKRAKHDVWVVDYRDGAGIRRRVTAPSRESAEILFGDKIRESRQALPSATDREITLSAYAARWLGQIASDLKANTHRSYSETLERYILPELGRVKVRALHRGLIKDLLARKRNDGLSKNTVRVIRAVLSVLLGDAVDDAIIASNPALQLGRRRRKRADSLTQAERLRKLRPMSREQLAVFLQTAQRPEHRRLYPLFLALARAGLRPGEAFGLQWDDVDLVERTIRIERSYSHGEIGTPKTGAGRAVDMSQQLAGALRRLEIERTEEKLRRGWTSVPAWVFCSEVGTPMDLYNATRVFKRVLKAAKLPNFRLYDLRHTFASLLLTQGAPITYVAAQLGHSKPTTTLQWYAHWLPTSRRTFVDALDEGAGHPEAIADAADAVAVTPPAPAREVRSPAPRERSGRRRAAVPARHGTNRAPFPQVSKDPEMEMWKKVGSPGWSRTSDFLITDEGRHRAGPQFFCIVPRNRQLPLEFLLLALGTEQDSRRAQGLKSAWPTGAFGANGRKQSDPAAS